MLDGRASLHIFDQHLHSAKDALGGLHARMERLNQQLEELRRDSADQYRALARARLDELTAQQLVGRMERTHEAVLKLLDQKKAARAQLALELENCQTRIAAFDGRRAALQEQRDQALAAVDAKLAEVDEILKQNPTHQELKSRWQRAISQAEQARTKAGQSQKDRDLKGRPYEEDPLFMYLWRRRYQTPDYKGRGLTRSLDAWVARRVHYDQNRANYHMLTLLPKHLQAHAESLQEKVEQLRRELSEMESVTGREAGVDELRAAHTAAQDALAQLSERVEAEEKHQDGLLVRQAEYAGGTDEHTRKAVEIQIRELKERDLSDLYEAARRTPGPEDDVLVARLGELRDAIARTEKELQDLQESLQKQHRSYTELEDLRGWFRRSTYDSQWYGLPGKLDLGLLLGQLLSGVLSGREIRDQIGRQGRFQRRCKPRYRKKYTGRGLRFPQGGELKFPRSGSSRGRRGGGFRTGGRF
ncbi:MAG: hypothetical protein WBG37_01815 [Desulfobacterales bacterium]